MFREATSRDRSAHASQYRHRRCPPALALIVVFAAASSSFPRQAAAQDTAGTRLPDSSPAPVRDAERSSDAKERAKAAFDRGMVLLEKREFEAALAELRSSVEAFPTRAARQNAAVVLKSLRRYDEAADGLEAVLRDYPKMPDEDRTTIAGELAEVVALLGYVDVKASESDASIVVDGAERGKTPATIRIGTGTRFVRVYKEGFVAFETRVEVKPRSTVPVFAKLGALLQGGRLAVTEGDGASVDVIVDNTVVGRAPWEGTLAVGKHTVRVRGEGKRGSMPAAVEVKLNQLSKLQLLSEPLGCRLRVAPTPPTAVIAIDGAELGRGVWSGAVRCGGHIIEIGESGYLSVRKLVSVAKDRDVTLSEQLERDPASDVFKSQHPARVFAGIVFGIPLAASLGGPYASSCGAGCSSGVGVGVSLTARIGYRLPVGLGVGADVGVLYVRGRYESREQALYPVGGRTEPFQGKANDAIALTGPFAGISISYESGDTLLFGGRLGLGAMLATVRDKREFRYSRSDSVATFDYVTNRELQDTSNGTNKALVVYARPDVHVGLHVGKRFVVEIGVEAWILVNTSKAVWADKNVLVGDPNFLSKCPGNPSGERCYAGFGTFNPGTGSGTAIVGDPMFLLSPYVGGRVEF